MTIQSLVVDGNVEVVGGGALLAACARGHSFDLGGEKDRDDRQGTMKEGGCTTYFAYFLANFWACLKCKGGLGSRFSPVWSEIGLVCFFCFANVTLEIFSSSFLRTDTLIFRNANHNFMHIFLVAM